MSQVKNKTSAERNQNIPKGWVETTLEEVTYFVNDKISISNVNISSYVSTENLLPDRLGKTVASNIPSISKVNHYKIGDTLFSNIRTYFKKVWLSNTEGGSSNDVLIFRPKSTQVLNNKFLFFLISSDYFIDFTVKSAKGTKMPRGDKNAIKGFSINLPPLLEQKSIAKVLTAFDDKIENLRAQNETLEQTAQTLFTEWFGKYQIGDELPEGWRVGKLGEVTKICGGTTPSTKNPNFWDGDIHWTSPKDLSNSKEMFLLSTEKMITKAGLKKISSGLLPKNTLLLSSRAPIGYLSFTNVELAINQGFIALLADQYLSNQFMYLWLNKFMKVVENAGNGSTFLEISKTSFRTIDCIIPEKNILKDFDDLIKPLFDKILSNLTHIQTLSQTRDTLLPKLMSGQLRVKGFKN